MTSHSNDDSRLSFADSEAFQSMPKSIIDRMLTRKTRFTNLQMTEDKVEDIIHKAAEGGYDLDFSGAILEGDMPFVIIDCLSRNNYFNFAHVNLNSTSIPIRGFDALVDSIVCFPELRTFTVRGNSLPKEAGMSLAKVLGARASLQVLDARDNNLSDAGVAAISGAFTADLSDLSDSTTISLLSLTVLDLSDNFIGDAGLLALCRGLTHFAKSTRSARRPSSLQVLRLANNRIGDKAAVCLAQFLESFYCTGHFALEELSLSGNPIGRTGMVAILDSIQGASAKNATLIKLSMDKCHPSLEVLEEAARLLRQPTTCRLRMLELSANEEESNEMCTDERFLDTIVALSDAVATNEHIAVLTLGELPDATRRQVLTSAPGSPRYYGLRVAMDCFRSMLEVLRMASSQQRQLLSQLESGQPVSVLKLQQDEFQKLRKEHMNVFHELSDSIRRLPLDASELQQAGNEKNSRGDLDISYSTIQPTDDPTNGPNSTLMVPYDQAPSPHTVRSTAGRLAGSRSSSPHTVRRGSGRDTLNSSGGSITTDHIGEIVKEAVSNALEAAQQQWMLQLKSGNFSHPELGPEAFHHRFTQLVARVDVVQDQVQGLDAQALSLADKSQVDELQRLLIGIENRVSRLEDRMDKLESAQRGSGPDKESLTQRLTELSERMSSLESSVETEHETSLDLLEVLLKQQQQQSQSSRNRRESRDLQSSRGSPKQQRPTPRQQHKY